MELNYDPLKLEIIKNAFINIAEEMSSALQRSAYSTNIKTRRDFSCVLCDSKRLVIAQSFSQPAHLGILSGLVPHVVEFYGIEKLKEGDVIATNDPYHKASHLNDIALISPVFQENEIVGFVANIAHHVDVGGGAPGSISLARELYQEGIIIPPIKLYENGKLNTDIFQLFLRNLRAKKEVAGDLRAQMAGIHAGNLRMKDLITKYGAETIKNYSEELMNYTERLTKDAFKKFPNGEFMGKDFLDDDGFSDEPIKISVKIIIDGKGITADFSDTDLQRQGSMNATSAFTFTAVSYVLKCLISDDIPINDGFYRCIKMTAPLGCVVNASEPAGVVGAWEVTIRVVNALWRAFAEIFPDIVPACSKGSMCQVGFGGYNDNDEPYAFYEAIGGGVGGRNGKDGADACQSEIQNTENAPVEEVEMNYPVRIIRYELIQDSGGSGEFRGGLGIRRDYMFPNKRAIFTILSDRYKFPPWGIKKGMDGFAGKCFKIKENKIIELKSKCTFDVEPGEIVSFQTPGGGGYNDPRLRSEEAVRFDILNEKISSKKAKEDYNIE